MAIRIKNFSDGSFLEYDRGSFDNWCVYMTNTEGIRKPPKDTEYFMQLVEYSKKYGNDRIEFIGIKDISAIFRNFIVPFYNYKFDYITDEFGVIKGQDRVIESILDIIERDDLNLYPRTKPITFLFAGSSGVGKSETAKILAKELVDSKPIILNMT